MSDTCYIGTTLKIRFGPVPDIAGGLVDLTGATVVCEARPTAGGTDVAASVASVIDGARSIAGAEFSAEQTAAFTPGSYTYDAHAVLPDGRKIALCRTSVFLAAKLVSMPT